MISDSPQNNISMVRKDFGPSLTVFDAADYTLSVIVKHKVIIDRKINEEKETVKIIKSIGMKW